MRRMGEGGKGAVTKVTEPTAVGLALRFDWDDLKIFAATVEAGSFSAAARMLGITHSSVSKRVEELEARLGAKLLYRNPGGVTLTEAGVLVRDHALTMQRSADAVARLVQGRDSKQEGRVTVAAPDGVSAFWVAPQLAEFLRVNPNVRIGLDCGFWAMDPLTDPPDLAIVVDRDERKLDFVFTPLAVLHYCIFVSPEYLNTYGMPQSLADVANHRILHHTALSHQKQNWDERASALQALSNPSLETNSSASMILALKDGAGIGAAPSGALTIAPDLVMLGPPMSKIQLWLCHHRDALKVARVKLVADWLKDIFDPRQFPWFRDEFVHPDEFREQARTRRRTDAST